MKRALYAGVGIFALAVAAQSAGAADLPRAPVVKAPPVAAIFNWSGFYVGLQAGYGWADVSGVITNVAGALPGRYDYKPDGFIGGGHIGYNYQFPGSNFVAGWEADLEWSGIDGSTNFVNTNATGYTHSTDVEWLASARVRLGLAADNWLFYATGGAAWAKADYSVAQVGTPPFHRHEKTHSGWTLGAGIEYAYTQNFTGRLEYRYADLGGTTNTNVAVNSRDSLDLKLHAVRVGLTYKY